MFINNINFIILITTIILRPIINFAENVQSKNSLPYFRRKVEEITDGIIDSKTDDPQSELVSFLVKNAKKIFAKKDMLTIAPTFTFWPAKRKDFALPNSTSRSVTKKLTTYNIPCSTAYMNSTLKPFEYKGGDVMLYANLKLTPLPFLSDEEFKTLRTRAVEEDDTKSGVNIDDSPLDPTISLEPDNVFRASLHDKANTPVLDTNEVKEVSLHRSCIFCDNVAFPDCSRPEKKLIPSTVCPNKYDVCFSQHTPFGIVTRGCYNTFFNLTTYVCSCNLCNYFGFGEMPRIFPNHKDWVDNIIELSRTRGFRRNIFKEMSCLACEVNGTDKSQRSHTDLNCLEGKIETLPTQRCNENEICAVKAIKNTGYVWRGCIKRPLYNYWISLCDHDLCNIDPIKSIIGE